MAPGLSANRKLARNGVLGDHDCQKSGVTFLPVLLEDDGFEDCCSCGTAFQGDPTPDRYLVKVAVMAPTTARTVKNTRKPYPPTTISKRLWYQPRINIIIVIIKKVVARHK
jgi:hypothetical protein